MNFLAKDYSCKTAQCSYILKGCTECLWSGWWYPQRKETRTKREKACWGGGAHLLFLNVWGYNFTCDKRQEKNSISCEISLCEYRVLTVKNEVGNRFIRQKTVLWWVLRLLQCFNQHDSLDDPLNYTLSLMIHLTAHNLHKSDGQFGFELNQDRTVFN